MGIGVWWVWLNGHAGWVLAVGLVFVVVRNACKWQRDRARAARLRAAPAQPVVLTTMPPLSVLVAAWNEADTIAAHIRSFRRLSYADKELLLCAGGEDGTYQVALEHAGRDVVVLEQLAGEGKQYALQRCWEQAKGEIMYLTDADCLMTDETVLRIVASLVDEGEYVSTGTCKPQPSQQHRPFVTYQWAVDLYTAARRGRYVPEVLGANWCVRRESLNAVGGFDIDDPIGEDYLLSILLRRAGYRIRYVPDSVSETEYSETFLQHSQRLSRWLRNSFLHGRAYGDRVRVHNVLRMWAAGLGGLLLLPCSLLLGKIAVVAWLLLAASNLAVGLRCIAFARLLGVTVPPLTFVQLPAFVFVDWFCAVRALLELAVPSRRWRW
jgi:cellulose synthase/poly-beta-1,6-N-acetylglucosamine synthase-like glycosyltransferase